MSEQKHLLRQWRQFGDDTFLHNTLKKDFALQKVKMVPKIIAVTADSKTSVTPVEEIPSFFGVSNLTIPLKGGYKPRYQLDKHLPNLKRKSAGLYSNQYTTARKRKALSMSTLGNMKRKRSHKPTKRKRKSSKKKR